jgi:hypothetical protein
MQKKFIWRVFLLIGLIVLCAVLVLSLCFNIRTLKRSGGLHPSRVPFRRHSSIPNPKDIQDWMTFGYIEYLFHLPKTYLPEKLNIDQTNYKNLKVSSFAKDKNISTAQALTQVQDAVTNFEGTPR